MKIGLIDVDGHNFPNLALMKISSFHKSCGDSVEWYDLGRKMYDIVYMSKVFSDKYTQDRPTPHNARKVVRGGTGYSISDENGNEVYSCSVDSSLPYDIEHSTPDYSLYAIKDKAYGYLTRGCPRNCPFCIVSKKEGKKSVLASPLSEFWNGQKEIVLLDPNILASKHSVSLLNQLKETGASVDFTQGLDARIITKETAELLADIPIKSIHFAMDTVESIDSVLNGMMLYKESVSRRRKWHESNKIVFVLTNFNTGFSDDLRRIEIIRQAGYLPYVMIYDKPNSEQKYKLLQNWANFTPVFKKMTFEEFVHYKRNRFKSEKQEVEGQERLIL